MGQNPVPLVNIKIAGKWMFIPLKIRFSGMVTTKLPGLVAGRPQATLSQCPMWQGERRPQGTTGAVGIWTTGSKVTNHQKNRCPLVN